MNFKQIKDAEQNYYMHTFSRAPVAFTHGSGTKLYDTAGKEYVDFFAGIAVNCLGYDDPELSAAIADQARRLIHVSNIFYTQEQAAFTKALLSGTDFNRVFISNSGAEANECAIKIVRKMASQSGSGKTAIITAKNSFHGRTITTATATGQPKYSEPFSPLTPGFIYVPYNDITALRDAVSPAVGAIMIETIQGEGGVVCADYDYMNAAYILAKSKNILLIIDEVQTGTGRTGKFFSYEHFGIIPDIVTLAKGLAGGVPIGATLARGAAAEALTAGSHGSTFGGNPLACRAGTVVVNRVKNPAYLKSIEEKGEYLLHKLTELKNLHAVTDVRGRGLLVGLELLPGIINSEITGKMLSAGYIINACGNNTIRFCPPYIISHAEIDSMAEALKDIIATF